jgi:hypothetical protein
MNEITVGSVFLNHIDNMEKLRKEIKDHLQKLISADVLKFDKDARFIFLAQWDKILIPYYLELLSIIKDYKNPKPLANMLGLDHVGILEVFKIRTTYTRSSLLLIFFSILETFMRNIYNSQFAGNGREKITMVINEICIQLSIDNDCEFYKALTILKLVRNTIHNNGLHKMPSCTVIYRGRVYEFEEGKPHSAFGIENIEPIMADVFDGVMYILSHESVELISDIHDPGTNFYSVINQI